jgi:hypothetical protein
MFSWYGFETLRYEALITKKERCKVSRRKIKDDAIAEQKRVFREMLRQTTTRLNVQLLSLGTVMAVCLPE